AMLCSKPIVATSVGGMAEQVTPECGRVVRPRDPQALAGAILDVLASPETCQALSRAARERAVTLFGIERFRATHREIYGLILDAREPRSSLAERPCVGPLEAIGQTAAESAATDEERLLASAFSTAASATA